MPSGTITKNTTSNCPYSIRLSDTPWLVPTCILSPWVITHKFPVMCSSIQCNKNLWQYFVHKGCSSYCWSDVIVSGLMTLITVSEFRREDAHTFVVLLLLHRVMGPCWMQALWSCILDIYNWTTRIVWSHAIVACRNFWNLPEWNNCITIILKVVYM